MAEKEKKTRKKAEMAVTNSVPARPVAKGDLTVTRSMPESLAAEAAVLGSMIVDPRCIGDVVELLNRHAFYHSEHQILFDAIINLYERNRGEGIDGVLVRDELERRNQTDAIGGIEYLQRVIESVPSSANVQYYAEIVREKMLLRETIAAATEILNDAYDESGTAGEKLDEAERKIFAVTDKRITGSAVVLKDLVTRAYELIEKREGTHVTGLGTGYYELDDTTCGLQNGEMVIIAGRPSMGKCLAAHSELVLRDGSVVTIEEVYKAHAAELLTLKADWKFDFTRPSRFVDDGSKPVFRVRTRLGREIETTLTHPFLTLEGWKPLGELRAGTRVAVPRTLPVFGNERVRECEVKLLAYLLGDGCLTHSSPTFTNTNARIREDFAAAAREFGGIAVRECDSNGTRATSLRVVRDDLGRTRRQAFGAALKGAISSRRLSARKVALAIGASPASVCGWQKGNCVPDEPHWARLRGFLAIDEAALIPEGVHAMAQNRLNGLAVWLKRLGLLHCDAHTKFIPGFVFRLERDLLALFLNRLFATDGWAASYRTGQAQIGFSSVSARMIKQVQHLLLRFGIIASVRRRAVQYAGERRPSFQLEITDGDSLRTFVQEIGIFGKEEALAQMGPGLSARRKQTNVDLIPREIWSRLEAAKGSESWSSLARRAGVEGWTNIHVGKRDLSRTRLKKFADALRDSALQQLANSDVFWDRLVSIEPLGPQQVYDLTVPATHNFVANDICVHNTALALNIAEHVGIVEKTPLAVFSLEMGRQQLAERFLCSYSGVDAQLVRKGMLSTEHYQKLVEACGVISEAPIYIDDTSALTPLELRAKARRLRSAYGIQCVLVDYLQLMHVGTSKIESRQQEISTISRYLKSLARELNVPVVVLSQLNRAPEGREGHRPRMSDLRESGSIEQDADVVMLLHREDYYHRGEDGYEPDNTAEIIIAKQRNGPTGTVKLTFREKCTRFENLAQIEQETVPF